MKYKIHFLPTAWADITKIMDYYAKFNKTYALLIIDEILKTIDKLTLFPELGSISLDPWLHNQKYRKLLCKNYIIFYRFIDDEVYIYHIANAKTDYIKLFN